MEDLRDDPEYEVRWPHDILADALDRLIARGHAEGLDGRWQEEAETLLQQAFTSPVPLREFQERWNARPRPVIEDPF